ncbi:hypothetical protein [Burkholderia ubonensis]|uniref:hypothetical protein n=1 Tax=Burkholderia ubonensis TaxID=101571 RepID=UPI0012F7AF0A|nr:hypothetical protein [Burkholderia ubonensis]
MAVSNSVLQRSHSFSAPSAQKARSATGLGQELLRVQSMPDLRLTAASPLPASPAASSGPNSGVVFPEQFKSAFQTEARQALFAASPDKQGELSKLFDDSRNGYAQREITRFAEVYSQLLKLYPEAKNTLDALAQQYNNKILKDGLKDQSGFGAYSPEKAKLYEQRRALEKSLANTAREMTGANFLEMGEHFMAKEVLPYIQAYVTEELKCNLTQDQVKDLVDRAAKLAFDALRQARSDLAGEAGFGVGKLARDLDTVAVLPLLLRNILMDSVPKEQRQDPPAANEPIPGGPGQIDPAPPQVIHYHYNNYYDSHDVTHDSHNVTHDSHNVSHDSHNNSFDYSTHRSTSMSDEGARSTHSAMSGQIKQVVTVKQSASDAVQSMLRGDSQGAGAGHTIERHEQFADAMSRRRFSDSSVQLKAGSTTAHSDDVDSTEAVGHASSIIQTGDQSSLDVSRLSFVDRSMKNRPTPEYLRSQQFQSRVTTADGDGRLPAERMLLNLVRDAVDPNNGQLVYPKGTSEDQQLQMRMAIDKLRNTVVPSDTFGKQRQEEVLRAFAHGEQNKQVEQVCQLLKQLPKDGRLRRELTQDIQLMARTTNLLAQGGNPLTVKFLSALGVSLAGRNGAASTVSSSAATLQRSLQGAGGVPAWRTNSAAMTNGAAEHREAKFQQAIDRLTQLDTTTDGTCASGDAKLLEAVRGVAHGLSRFLDAANVSTSTGETTSFGKSQERQDLYAVVDGGGSNPDAQDASPTRVSAQRASENTVIGALPAPAVASVKRQSSEFDFANVKLEAPRTGSGHLYTVSTAASRGRQFNGVLNPSKELLRGVMDSLQLKPNQRDARAELAGLRTRLVDGINASATKKEDAEKLSKLLHGNNDVLQERKGALTKLVRRMILDNGMFSTRQAMEQADPVVKVVMQWLNVGGKGEAGSPDGWMDWVERQRPKSPAPVIKERVVTTTPGARMDGHAPRAWK